MSSGWIEVEPSELSTPQTMKRDGVSITVTSSPYDLPDGVRGAFDANLGKFVIEFRYVGAEPTVKELHDKYIVLRLGKNSGRLYAIEIDVEAAKAGWVTLIQKAIDERSRDAHKPRRLTNYEITRKLVERVPELSAAFAC
jgi:hypothetical protein